MLCGTVFHYVMQRGATGAMSDPDYVLDLSWNVEFKSAQEYKKIKKKKKLGAGWGIAAQVYIILSAIRVFVELVKGLAQ